MEVQVNITLKLPNTILRWNIKFLLTPWDSACKPFLQEYEEHFLTRVDSSQNEPHFYFSPFYFPSGKSSSAGHTKPVFTVEGKEAVGDWNTKALRVRDSEWKVIIIPAEVLA